MLSKIFVHSPINLWLEYVYSLVHEEILKSLYRLKLSDSDLSTGSSYPAFEQLGPGVYEDENIQGWLSSVRKRKDSQSGGFLSIDAQPLHEQIHHSLT